MLLKRKKQKKAKLEGKKITISAKAGSAGRLFGSVTTGEIATAIKNATGCDVDKRKISLNSDIKNYGTYNVEVKLHQGISAQLTVEVGE